MDGIIGRLQSKADMDGKRIDIHLETSVYAIKDSDGVNIKEAVENIGIGVTMSEEKPKHSSLWIIPG